MLDTLLNTRLDTLHTTHSAFARGHDRAGIFGDERRALLVVADGAGGQTGAARAASLVVDAVRDLAATRSEPLGVRGLIALLERLDRAVLSERDAGQTTAVVAEVVEDRFWGASVGDSGAWLVHERHHLDLTRAQHRKWRVGSGFARPIGFGPLPLVGTLMLASDGVLECAPPDRLLRAFSPRDSLGAVAGNLARAVRLPDGGLRDDVAVALCRLGAAAARTHAAA
ncbi:MAG: SpoIIE family protein phosphatase [Sandaracinaceae bacterium]